MEPTAATRKHRYAFLTLPNYSLIAVSNALEPLRMANRITGQTLYEWSIVSLDGLPVKSSSGLELTPTTALDKVGLADIVFVCGGVNVREAVSAYFFDQPKPTAVRLHLVRDELLAGA